MDIAQKCTPIGKLSKTAHFSGVNILTDVIYVTILIKHLTLQLGFAADILRFCTLLNCYVYEIIKMTEYSIKLNEDEAIVLFEYFYRFDDTGSLAFEHAAEYLAL